MRALALRLDRISAALNAAAIWGAIISILVMIGAAGWQVIARYLLSQPPAWTEELARFAMVWSGVLGASCAFRVMADPALFPGMRSLSGPSGHVLAVIRALGVLALVVPILWFSVFGANMNPGRGYIARLAGRQAETMDVPMTVFGIAIPIAFALILIHLTAQLAVQFSGTHNEDRL